MSRTKTILLWIAVPFAAILAMQLGYAVGKIIQAICLNRVLIGAENTISIISDIAGELTAGVCFVAAGTAVAPSNKKTVSTVLATIAGSFATICIVFLFATKALTLIEAINLIAMVAGAIGYACNYEED